MAARRALRKLGSSSSPLLRDPAARKHFGENPWQSGRSSFHISGKSDDDENEQRRRARIHPPAAGGSSAGLGYLSRIANAGVYSPRAGGFSHRSVRFCSSAGVLGDAAQHSSSIPEVLVDAAQEVVANLSPADEILAATADSYPWTASVQYIIYDVHKFTGLPWWISISLTTLAIRMMMVPLVVYQVKSTARFTLMRPELEKIKAKLKDSDYSPEAVAEHRKKMSELFTRYKTDPFTPLIGALLQGPVFMCFFFGLRTMADTMESFKTGGAFWFTDLSTPDDLYLLPLITALTFLITVELGSAEGMQGQPNQKMIKNFLRGMGVLFLPLTASFQKALFCYWVTSNLWSMVQGAVLRNRSVKTFLQIPDTSRVGVPPPPPVISSKPPKKTQVFEKKPLAQ